MQWVPGSLAVFEGLDRAGKTRQMDQLLALPWDSAPAHAHMPSGVGRCTEDIYMVTEARKAADPLAVQLLHLAAHVINMPELLEVRAERGLILDRYGWSTLAYGGFGEGMDVIGVASSTFIDLVLGIWSRMEPDVVFLFDEPFDLDVANTSIVQRSYRTLAEEAGSLCVKIERGSPAEVHQQILTELISRRIVVF